ncbi:Aryl-alcohol dehydrogenase protein [Rutstroemia sp. NJR-2017a WRK4]|nr:Aryl-alcohol dehydrogenase protein [Rutstroemia sp. NJR-2017a WRK4]
MPKKQISDRRRLQNKQAQKTYRDRQKRNLELLRDIAISTHAFSVDGASDKGRELEFRQGSAANTSPYVDSVDSVYNASSTNSTFTKAGNTARSLGDLTLFPHTHMNIGIGEHSRSPSVPRLQLAQGGLSENSAVSHLFAQHGVNIDENTKSLLRDGKLTLKGILEAGLKAIAHQPSAPSTSHGHGDEDVYTSQGTRLRTDKILVLQNIKSGYVPPFPDVHQNHFRIQQVMFAAACVANANSMGMHTCEVECNDTVISPFFRNSISEAAAKAACLKDYDNLGTHLRPCPTQLMISHHPAVDVLPFPTFRERFIRLTSGKEPMIDEDDLWQDLENDGLICWGSSLGGGTIATGSGAPWDIRSWEAQPWFIKKWWVLIGGAEGEIYKQTRWWREMRGEQACNPW